MNPKIYTTKEVAEIMQVTSETIRNEIKRGSLRCFYVGNEARFTNVHLEEYMNVKNFGKTIREIQLEKEKKELEKIIETKDNTITNIKNFILKEVIF